MRLHESVFKKVQNIKNTENQIDDIIGREVDKKHYFRCIVDKLKSKGVDGVEECSPFIRQRNLITEENLRKFEGKTAYFFLHNEEYVTDELYVISVYSREMSQNELKDEEDWDELQSKNEIHKLGYFGLHIYDYAVFGAKDDEKDTDVQINLVSCNNIRDDEYDWYRYRCSFYMTDEDFTFEENYSSWNPPHYKVNYSLLEKTVEKCGWIIRNGQKLNEFICDCCGGYNGVDRLQKISKFFKLGKDIIMRTRVNESVFKKVKSSGKSLESIVDKEILDVSDYTKFFTLMYKTSLGKFEEVMSFCYDVDRMVSDDNLLKNMVYFNPPSSSTCIPRIVFRRFMELPLRLRLSPNGKNTYYISPVTGQQVRGERFNIEVEFKPVFRSKYGGLSSWSQDGQMPIGFRIELDFDVDCWILEGSKRKYKHADSRLSNEFRIVPDLKNKFKLVLGNKSATDRELFWDFSAGNFFQVRSYIFSIFDSMENGKFEKEFLEPLFEYEKGVVYSEYEKNPKKYKNFVYSTSKSRLDYLRDNDPNYSMSVEEHKLERYLFTELIRNNYQKGINESVFNKVKRISKNNIEDEVEEIFDCTAEQTFENVLKMIQNDKRFVEMDFNTEIDIRNGYYSAEKVLEDKMTPKAKRFAKNKLFYYKVQYFERNDDIPSLYVWKPMLIDGNPCLLEMELYNSINNNKEIRNRKVALVANFIGEKLHEYFHLKNEDGRLVSTETGKEIDYEIDTTVKNNRLIFETIVNLCSNAKKIAEFYYVLEKYDKMNSLIRFQGMNKNYPRMKKQEKIEKQQELDEFGDTIRKKYKIKQQIPYLNGVLARKWINKFI